MNSSTPTECSPFRWVCTLLLILSCSPAFAQEPLQRSEATVEVRSTFRYWQYLPEDYAQSAKKYPLILFLHGGGESGDDLELVKKHGLPKELMAGRKLPCIVLAPQNPDKDRLWDDRALMSFLEQRLREIRVDEKRIYLAGMSRGGHAAYQLVIQNPKRFAAAAVACGGGAIAYAWRAQSTPLWFFHGEKDEVVPADESRRLHAAVNAARGNAKLTLYPDVRHDCWTQTFANNELYEWLLAQRRAD